MRNSLKHIASGIKKHLKRIWTWLFYHIKFHLSTTLRRKNENYSHFFRIFSWFSALLATASSKSQFHKWSRAPQNLQNGTRRIRVRSRCSARAPRRKPKTAQGGPQACFPRVFIAFFLHFIIYMLKRSKTTTIPCVSQLLHTPHLVCGARTHFLWFHRICASRQMQPSLGKIS